MRVLELFGGIGACTKALERLGIDYEIADYVEIDKYAVKSFNAMHNTDFKPQDICNWDKDIDVDLIMHGSPCQDFSVAGKNAGGDEGSGTRSSLMYETIRIVEKLKPKYVIWENVKNILSKKHRHNFDNYLSKMEELGYKNYWQVLNSKDYGIPQNRERVFTISILGNESYGFPKGNVCDNKINMVEIPQKVKIRKHKIDTEKLKNVLREHKNKSNKIIAESLNKPITLVEHWFRKDNCFSIPDADIWFELKELLSIKTNEFDKAITTFEEKDNVYEKSNRFYYDVGLAPTITSASANEKIIETFIFPSKQELKLKLKDMLEDEVDEKYYIDDGILNNIVSDNQAGYLSGGKWDKINESCRRYYKEEGLAPTIHTCQGENTEPKVLIKNATKKGYSEAYDGDSVNLSYPNSKTRRGRVGEQVSQTLQCNDSMCVVEKSKYSEESLKRIKQNIIKGNIANTLTANAMQSFNHNNCALINNDLRIRKLTPKECWRLMGFDDKDFEKASQVCSNTQLYKQAGNSIVVNVLEKILENLLCV